jgi:hypothetical protein
MYRSLEEGLDRSITTVRITLTWSSTCVQFVIVRSEQGDQSTPRPYSCYLGLHKGTVIVYYRCKMNCEIFQIDYHHDFPANQASRCSSCSCTKISVPAEGSICACGGVLLLLLLLDEASRTQRFCTSKHQHAQQHTNWLHQCNWITLRPVMTAAKCTSPRSRITLHNAIHPCTTYTQQLCCCCNAKRICTPQIFTALAACPC